MVDNPNPTPEYTQPTLSDDDKTMALLAHLLGIVLGFIGPLIIWLIKKDTSAFVNDQAKEALNFQITILIAWVIAGVLCVVLIGFVLIPVIWLASIILSIMAGMAAKDGNYYRYPMTIRLIS